MSVPAILLDLNVILDFLQGREPHARHADLLFSAAAQSRVSLWITGDAPSTLFYVLERQFRQDREPRPSLRAQELIRTLLARISVAPVTKEALQRALDWCMEDYEDAIQAACALDSGVGWIVTRDGAGYRDLPPNLLAVLSPAEALAHLDARPGTARSRSTRRKAGR
jgi:predicted nucleic acid-binding protein